MTDILAVLFGVLLGTLASVPVALVIAASTTHGPARSRRANLPALDVRITGRGSSGSLSTTAPARRLSSVSGISCGKSCMVRPFMVF